MRSLKAETPLGPSSCTHSFHTSSAVSSHCSARLSVGLRSSSASCLTTSSSTSLLSSWKWLICGMHVPTASITSSGALMPAIQMSNTSPRVWGSSTPGSTMVSYSLTSKYHGSSISRFQASSICDGVATASGTPIVNVEPTDSKLTKNSLRLKKVIPAPAHFSWVVSGNARARVTTSAN